MWNDEKTIKQSLKQVKRAHAVCVENENSNSVKKWSTHGQGGSVKNLLLSLCQYVKEGEAIRKLPEGRP